ncbi:hypothetical protein AB0D27_45200 [Streptomyces sp. NPDC048415]|uniref:hypothetical protein n=1 Tax=Streptomyces sp. NPDC048415 TaxID=3154822 RepID=UPI0034212124
MPALPRCNPSSPTQTEWAALWCRIAARPALADAVILADEPQNGDAVIAGRGMLDCFEGKPVTYWPRRKVEVRAGGRWHEGELRCHYRGPDGRAVAWVEPRFYEPEWRAVVTFSRFYRWDPATIRCPATPNREHVTEA